MKGPGCLEVSLVSHGHGDMVLAALESLAASLTGSSLRLRVWLTLNLPEPDLEQAVMVRAWPWELQWIRNSSPLGFGANHNQAFARAQAAGVGRWFLVMNPDIYWPAGATSFWHLLEQDAWPVNVGLICPSQVDLQGAQQDFARQLMTPWGLTLRVLRRMLGRRPTGVAASVVAADWVNGACMVWRAEAFATLKGFDERYFMYCEDTDICLRLQLANWQMQGSNVQVIHDAQRHTGRHWRHLRWHVRSLLRLWASTAFWRYQWLAWTRRRAT